MTSSNQYETSPQFTIPPLKNDLILRVINKLPVPRVPVWMMRQAGRTDPVYRKIRADDKRPLEELFNDVEKSIEISLLPQRIGMDAIIMYQDILTPLAPLGIQFYFRPGPTLEQAIRTPADLDALQSIKNPEVHWKWVGDILKGLHQKLNQELPILGFAGSPMTLAFFMIAGKSPNQNVQPVLDFIQENPDFIQDLMDRLAELTIEYLNYQIASGANAVQLFESFGDVLSRDVYERFVQPVHKRIFDALDSSAPSILFVKECRFMDLMQESGATVLSVGKCNDIRAAQEAANGELIFQGNVDNQILLNGSKDEVTKAIQECLDVTGKQNHILNLNHGLLAKTPFENVIHFVETAKRLGKIEL